MPTFVVGDVHGHREALVRLLRDAGLLDARERWSGRDARLYLLGDLIDRGPDGIGAVELVMRLEREGPVRCLLGNHEAGLFAVFRFRDQPVGRLFHSLWELNGGLDADLERLRPEHAAWLGGLPAIALDEGWLLVHSDTVRYLELGWSASEICRTASARLTEGDPAAVDDLLGILADRLRLHEEAAASLLLRALGGERIVHGHTPIAFVADRPPDAVTEPLLTAGGRVLNVDHGLYAGGAGFVTELPSLVRDEAGTEPSDPAP